MSALTKQQAIDCFASDDLIGLGMEADAVRRELHPEGRVTYSIERSLAWPENAAAAAALDRVISEAVEMGATSVHFTGPLPAQTLVWFESFLTALKERFPALAVLAFTPAELAILAHASGAAVPAILSRLKAAGLDSLSHAACDAPLADFLAAHRSAHELGLRTVAAIHFGGDAPAFLESLFAIAALQAETHGFSAFVPVPVFSANPVEAPTAVESLKTTAVARLVLDTIPSIAAHAPSQGLKVLQMALRFGADDAGPLALPERRPRIHKSNALTEEELRRTIRDAGFQPAERDPGFRTWFMG